MKIYDSYEELLEIEDQWNTLVKDSIFPNIFLTWEWLSIWWDSFGRDCKLKTAVFFTGPTLIAAIPMYECKVSFLRGLTRIPSLCLIGDGPLVSPDYLGPIVKKEYIEEVTDSLIAFFDEVFISYRVIRLAALNIKSEGTASFVNKLLTLYPVKITEDENCPTLILPDSYELFLSGVSNKRRKRINYELRRAEKKFSVILKCFQDEKDVDCISEIISEVYDHSTKKNTIAHGFANIQYCDFHARVIKIFASKGWLRFYTLYFNDEPVSYVYGYVYNSTFWFYQTSFNVTQKKFAAGSILLQLVIKSTINEGVKEFDFLRGDEPYKYHYNSKERALSTAYVFRNKYSHYLIYTISQMVSNYYKKLRR